MTAAAPRPEWAKLYGGGYEGMVHAWGTVHEFITCGSWQGDYVALITDESNRLGFIVIGYGSCPGCDSYEAVAPWDDDGDWRGVVDLERELHEQVRWFDTADEFATYAATRSGKDWWAHDQETEAAVRKCVETAREVTR